VLRVLVEEHGPVDRAVVTLSHDQLAALRPETRDWMAARGVEVLHDVVEPGVGLAGAADGFADGRLVDWVARWEASDAARTDLVVSDNLTGVLGARPDAVLMGSFLWSDVLGAVASGPAVDAFVAQERALLAAHRPPMLATADVVHPGVVERTAVVALPWADDRLPELTRQPEPSGSGGAAGSTGDMVAVLGGRTGAADDALGRVRDVLLGAGRKVVTDPSALHGPRRARLGLLVCRPGLGTVTAGVIGSLPMLLVREPGNPELDHMAAALVAHGLARTLDHTDDPGAILAAVEAMEEGPVRMSMRAALAARPTGGHRAAAAWLARSFGVPTSKTDGRDTPW
jgi:hypothetical protein